jgi:hypothetical protein
VILLDDAVPGAGSSLGTAPTGTSAGRRAPGRVMEPAPVSLDPVDLPTPDSDGEVPPTPMPGEPADPGRW